MQGKTAGKTTLPARLLRLTQDKLRPEAKAGVSVAHWRVPLLLPECHTVCSIHMEQKTSPPIGLLPLVSVALFFIPFFFSSDIVWSGISVLRTSLFLVLPWVAASFFIKAVVLWKGASLSIKESLLSSIVANAFSFGLGAVIYFLMTVAMFFVFLLQLIACGEGPGSEKCLSGLTTALIFVLALGIGYFVELESMMFIIRRFPIRRIWLPLLIGNIITGFIVLALTGWRGQF